MKYKEVLYEFLNTLGKVGSGVLYKRVDELENKFGKYFYSFKTDENNTYFVNIYKEGTYLTSAVDSWNVTFILVSDSEIKKKGIIKSVIKKERTNNSYKLSGTGNAGTVFATIANIILDFFKIRKPERITFSASKSEPSRVRLYNVFAPMLAKKIGYDYRIEDMGDEYAYIISIKYD